MSSPEERDSLAELAASNPVDPAHVPSASLARVDASVRREIESDRQLTRTGARHRPRRLVGAGLSGAVIAAAIVAVLARAPGDPVSSPQPSAPLGNAACVEQYSATTLRNREWAFDGTVTAIQGDEVTFTVNTAFTGPHAGVTTLLAPGMTGAAVTSTGGPTLAIGERYLVAGEDRFLWACGFTQPWDEDVAADWAAIFPD